jgi:hypothetical protein
MIGQATSSCILCLGPPQKPPKLCLKCGSPRSLGCSGHSMVHAAVSPGWGSALRGITTMLGRGLIPRFPVWAVPPQPLGHRQHEILQNWRLPLGAVTGRGTPALRNARRNTAHCSSEFRLCRVGLTRAQQGCGSTGLEMVLLTGCREKVWVHHTQWGLQHLHVRVACRTVLMPFVTSDTKYHNATC